MISKLDESVGKVVEALKQKGILENTIIMFYSDNGAPSAGLFANHGSNHPFRGVRSKSSIFLLFLISNFCLSKKIHLGKVLRVISV